MQLLDLVNEFDLFARPLCQERLEQLEADPVQPVGIDYIKVAEALAVEVLQHRGHAKGELDNSRVSIRTRHVRTVVDAVDHWRSTFGLNLLYRPLHDKNSIAHEVIDVMLTGCMETWLAKDNDSIIAAVASNFHYRYLQHAPDLLWANPIGPIAQAPLDPGNKHLLTLL